MYILHNTEAHLCNNCCSGKTKNNKYYIFWMCVCSLRYPACNACTPYSVTCGLSDYSIFSHYLINAHFVKKSYW